MPVKIPKQLPAFEHLVEENIFVMDEERAMRQDIRPLKIAILNLMPNKEVTETQLLRLLSNTPLQLEIVLLRTASYAAKNTSFEHLNSFYRTFQEIKSQRFDGMIITGAPVERMEFESVAYWKELVEILNYAEKNVFSKLYICWAAQAALYHLMGVPKYEMDKKLSGVFLHSTLNPRHPLTLGFDQIFYAPHSRHTEVRKQDFPAEIEVLAESEEAGVYLAASPNARHVFITGHGEYDADSLHNEFVRDTERGLDIDKPLHYYNKFSEPELRWRGHASLLFANWVNWVYQSTPYNLDELGKD